MRTQKDSKKYLFSHRESLSSHEARWVVYHQNYGARTVRSSLGPSEMTEILIISELGTGRNKRAWGCLAGLRGFIDNIAGTLNVTIGRMPNTAQGDAINTDGAHLIDLGQANVLTQCGEGLPRQTELGHFPQCWLHHFLHSI